MDASKVADIQNPMWTDIWMAYGTAAGAGFAFVTLIITGFGIWYAVRTLRQIEAQTKALVDQTGHLAAQTKTFERQTEILDRQTMIYLKQTEVNTRQAQIELFSKRYDLYIDSIQFIGLVLNLGLEIEPSHVSNYHETVSPAVYLFKDDVWKFLLELKAKGDELVKQTKIIRDLSFEEDRRKQASKGREEVLKWFEKQPNVLSEKVRPYLDLRDIMAATQDHNEP